MGRLFLLFFMLLPVAVAQNTFLNGTISIIDIDPLKTKTWDVYAVKAEISFPLMPKTITLVPSVQNVDPVRPCTVSWSDRPGACQATQIAGTTPPRYQVTTPIVVPTDAMTGPDFSFGVRFLAPGGAGTGLVTFTLTVHIVPVVLPPPPPPVVIKNALHSGSMADQSLAPDTFFTLFGTGISDATSAQVSVCGIIVPKYYASGPMATKDVWQINALTPSQADLAGKSSCPIFVTVNGVKSNAINVTMVSEAFSPFMYQERAEVTHSDYSLVTPTSPAKPGETVLIWGTGCKNPDPGIEIKVGGTVATISYAGFSGGVRGLCQLNVIVPEGTLTGDQWLTFSTTPTAYKLSAVTN